MRKELKFIFIVFLLSIFSLDAHATKRFWVGATSNSWKTTGNWSATSGGAGGASIPGSNDTAIFNGSATLHHRCNLDSLVNVKRLSVTGDTLSQGANTITIGSSGGNFTAGVFLGGSSSITVSGAFTIAGNTFTSTSGTFSSSGNFTFSSGSFTHNSGKVKFTATNTITGSITFYQLEFAPSGSSTFTIASSTTLTVNGTLTLSGSDALFLNTGTINAKGDIAITNSSNGGTGTATIKINGTSNQTLTGPSSSSTGQGKLPNIIINKSSDTLKLVNIISVYGNWTWTAGIIDAGTSTIHFANTLTISGSHSLYNVNFSGASSRIFTIASGTTLTIKGTMTINNTFDVTINTGTINAQGDISITNTATAGGGSATVNINGTGNQTLTGSGTGGQGLLPYVIINKSSGTLTLSSIISVKGDWTWTSGTINAGSSTLYFIATKTISGTHALQNVTFDGSAAATYTISSTLTVKGTLTINGSNTVTLSTGTIDAQGDVTVTNSATGASGNASLVFNGTGVQTLTGSGTAGQGRLPAITVNKTFGEVDLASVISIYGGWTQTKGKVDAHANLTTVDLYGTFNLNAQGSDGNVNFYNLTIAGNTTTLTGNLVVTNNLTINSSTTLSAGSNSITVGGNWNDNGTWTYATSSVTFNGSGYNTIAKLSGTETFYNLGFNRAATIPVKSQTLKNPVTVNNVLTLTRGHVISDTVNYLLLIDNATLSGGGDNAYVHGPVRKTGNDAFTFPLGDTTLVDTAYHPLAMTAPSSTGDQFQAIYYAHNQTYGDSIVDSLESVSDCEYWTLQRKAGSSNVNVTLTWNSKCIPQSLADATVVSWDGYKWIDAGSNSPTIGTSSGTLTSSLTISPIGAIPISKGSKKQAFRAFATLQRKPDGNYYNAYNTLWFKFNDEYNDASNHLTYKIVEVSSNNTISLWYSSNNNPLSYYGDNRFKLDLYLSNGSHISQGYYMFEVTDDKGEKWYLRFKNN